MTASTTRTLFTVIFVFLLFALFSSGCSTRNPNYPSKFENFVTRQGDKLFDGKTELRFMSFAMPELSMQESPAWDIIEAFEQEDAIKTIAALGGQVTRCYVFSITTRGKSITHIRGPRQYDEECFKAFDNLLMLCNKYGVRLIVPFIDTWAWWGGIEDFCAFRNKDKSLFWTDPELKADFKNLVSYVLNRVNTITGVPYRDDYAILAWETGNELRQSTSEWTREMAAHIKSIDRNHLVIDGRDQNHFDECIDDPNIDIITAHYYGQDFVKRFQADYARVQGRKPFIVGEFGLVQFGEIEGLVGEIVSSGATGGLVWSLRQHDLNGGFKWHNEGGTPYYAYHWPGFADGAAYDEPAVVSLIWSAAHRIQGRPLPPLPAPDGVPVMLPIKTVSDIRFRGVVNASGYDIERREGESGEWKLIAENVSDGDFDTDLVVKRTVRDKNLGKDVQADSRVIFADHAAEKGKTYAYRVRARNSSGVTAFSNEESVLNAETPSQPRSGVLKDRMNDFALMREHSANLAFATADAAAHGGDPSRLVSTRGAGEAAFAYETKGDINSVHVDLYSTDKNAALVFSTSTDGAAYAPLDIKRYVQETDAGGLFKITYFMQKLAGAPRFLKICFSFSTALPGQTQISLVKIGYGRMELGMIDIVRKSEYRGPYLIDDFESDQEPLSGVYKSNPGSGQLTLKLDTANKNGGKYGLRYDYDTGTPGYAGGTKQFSEPAVWTGNDYVVFWYIPDDSGNRLVLQFKEKSGEYWEIYKEITGTEPQTVRLRLSEFVIPPWGGGVDRKLDLSEVVEFSIYVNKVDTSKRPTGTLYFDDFNIVR